MSSGNSSAATCFERSAVAPSSSGDFQAVRRRIMNSCKGPSPIGCASPRSLTPPPGCAQALVAADEVRHLLAHALAQHRAGVRVALAKRVAKRLGLLERDVR